MWRIGSAFDATSTAAEVAACVDLSGRSVIVTGATSGIGVETARALAGAGASVTLAVRDLQRGAAVARSITASTSNPRVEVEQLDLSNLRSVDAFVGRWTGPLHVLVNNAGVMQTPHRRTEQGWELQFGTNHLGHFALATGLHDALSADGSARVVSVSSSGHDRSPVVLDDLFFDRRPYDPSTAYGQSKTAQVLFAVEATRRWSPNGITSNAVMPGGIWTNLQQHWDPTELAAVKASVPATGPDGKGAKTPEQGAATSIFVATSPDLEGIGGRYFEDCHEAEVVPAVTDGLHGVRGFALDPDVARELWDVATHLLVTARVERPAHTSR